MDTFAARNLVSSSIFEALLREKADIFRAAFSSVSTEVFYDSKKKQLRHAGEYGMFREAIVRDFLRLVVPCSLDMSSGFVVTSMDDVSTQCDIVIFDSRMTPLYQGGDRQRFFPVESVFCVGEVKSSLSKVQFANALNRLAAIKALSERIPHPVVLRKSTEAHTFDPAIHPYDLVPTVLICQRLNFNLKAVENEIDTLYGSHVEQRHKHNIILCLEDGLFTYFNVDGLNLPYPRIASSDLKHRFILPTSDRYVHLKLFASYMFQLTTSKTLLYPDFADYMKQITNGLSRDQA